MWTIESMATSGLFSINLSKKKNNIHVHVKGVKKVRSTVQHRNLNHFKGNDAENLNLSRACYSLGCSIAFGIMSDIE